MRWGPVEDLCGSERALTTCIGRLTGGRPRSVCAHPASPRTQTIVPVFGASSSSFGEQKAETRWICHGGESNG